MSHTFKQKRLDDTQRDIDEIEAFLEGRTNEGEAPAVSPTTPTEAPVEGGEGGTSPEATVVQQPTATDNPEENLEYWKDRAIKAEHRFNNFKPSADRSINKARQECVVLRKQMLDLKKEVAESKATHEGNPLDAAFTPEVTEVLGKNTVDAIKKVVSGTEEKVQRQEEKLEAQNLKMEEKRVKANADADNTRFLAALEKLVPTYKDINLDKKFLVYLEQVNDAGYSRLELLRAAQSAGDVVRVADFFKDFSSKQPTKNKDSLRTKIAPDSSMGMNESTTEQMRATTIDKAFVDKYYRDRAKGLYKNDMAKAAKIETLIDEAFMSGKLGR